MVASVCQCPVESAHCEPSQPEGRRPPQFFSCGSRNTPVSQETVLQTNPSFAINSSDKHFRAKAKRSAENQKSRAEMPDGLRIRGENCNDLVLQNFGKGIRPLVIAATERTGQPVQALAGAFGQKGARRALGRGQTGTGPVCCRHRASSRPRSRTDNGRGFTAQHIAAEYFAPAASAGSCGQPRIPASERWP